MQHLWRIIPGRSRVSAAPTARRPRRPGSGSRYAAPGGAPAHPCSRQHSCSVRVCSDRQDGLHVFSALFGMLYIMSPARGPPAPPQHVHCRRLLVMALIADCGAHGSSSREMDRCPAAAHLRGKHCTAGCPCALMFQRRRNSWLMNSMMPPTAPGKHKKVAWLHEDDHASDAALRTINKLIIHMLLCHQHLLTTQRSLTRCAGDRHTICTRYYSAVCVSHVDHLHLRSARCWSHCTPLHGRRWLQGARRPCP